MRILVNCEPDEMLSAKSSLNYFIEKAGHTGVLWSKPMTASEATLLCEKAGCDAVLCSNTATLANLVPAVKGKVPSLNDWRGSRLNYAVPIYIMNPISHIYSVPEGKFLIENDLHKIHYCRHEPKEFKYTVLKTVAQFDKWYELAKRSMIIGCDIETNQHGMKKNAKSSKRVPVFDAQTLDIKGLGETWITCLAFTMVMPNLKLETCVLPLVNGSEDYWSKDSDYAAAIHFMRKMMDLPQPKCFHNGLYDCYHLIRYRAWPRNWIFDTMGLSHSWYSELPKTVSFLASWTLYDAYYWKDLADSEHKVAGSMESYWLYNAKDTWAMTRSLIYLLQVMPDFAVVNYQKNFKNVYPSLYGAFEGWKVNLNTRDRLAEKAKVSLEESRARLQTIAADPKFNPGSSKQVAELLYDIMGAKKNPRAKSQSATDKKSRAFVAAQHPILARVSEILNQYQLDAKAVSTYFSFLVWEERLLFSVDPFGTETSRAASRGSAAWVGTQIQNQPPYAKEMYECDPGYIGFEVDYSKAEAVCTAHLAQCLKLIRALCEPELDKNGEPKDFYKVLGVMFFGMEYEKVTKDFRNKVLKKINHGTNYMMGAMTFIDNLDDINVLYFAAELLGITLVADKAKPSAKSMTMRQFAQSLLDSYHVPFPEVSAWWKSLKDEVIATGRLVSPTGHTRVFFGDPTKDHKIWRSAVAHQPQNLSVENLNNGQWRAYKYAQEFRDPSAIRLKTQIHDSINGQVKIEYARECIPKLAELIKAQCMVHGRLMVIDVDIEVYTTNWKEKISWKDFLETTLPMLESQKSLTYSTDG